MRQDALITTFYAPAPVAGYRIATFGAGPNSAATATARTDFLLGVTTQVGSSAAGTVDVIMAGITELQLGGAVSRGDHLTTDAQGRAVVAVLGTDRLVGAAMSDGVVDDIIAVVIDRG